MLAGSLSGPAYLVSHRGAAFPALVIVLRGAGIEIELEGQTNISKGIASVAFRSLPDVPIVGVGGVTRGEDAAELLAATPLLVIHGKSDLLLLSTNA